MKNFFRTKARIVNDRYLGYEVQFKFWWFPFWLQTTVNTHSSVQQAEDWAKKRLERFVKYVDH